MTHWEIGFLVTFTMLLFDKWKAPEQLISEWNALVSGRLQFADVCYLCWCFWLSLLLSFFMGWFLDETVGDIVQNTIVAAVLSRFLFTVIAKK